MLLRGVLPRTSLHARTRFILRTRTLRILIVLRYFEHAFLFARRVIQTCILHLAFARFLARC